MLHPKKYFRGEIRDKKNSFNGNPVFKKNLKKNLL